VTAGDDVSAAGAPVQTPRSPLDLGRALLEEMRRRPADTEKVLGLIAAGADLNLSSAYDRTPLHYAAEAGETAIAAALIRRGARLDAQNNHGNTPLAVAAIYGHDGVAALLLRAGARIDIVNHGGETALDWARRNGDGRIAALISTRLEEWRRQGMPLQGDLRVSRPLKLRHPRV
jgi:hypothetical protein